MTAKTTAIELLSVLSIAKPKLLQLDDKIVRHKPTPDRWSIAEVVGHLVDSACNNYQRFIRAQQVTVYEGPGYDQNFWAATGQYHGSDWKELVELWYLLNRQLSRVMESIADDQLATLCRVGDYEECSLEYLVTDYVVHLNHHLEKIWERI